jgi:hypothetical protein
MAMFIQDDPHHHLMKVGAMILTVAQLADRLASLSLKVNRGRIEKDAIQTGKKIPALKNHILLDQVLYTARREGCAVLLIFQLFSQKGHRPVEMMQRQAIDPIDQVITMPPVTGTIRTGNEKPMQNRQKYRSLYVELELPLSQKATDDFADLKFFPESLTNQGRTDLLGFRPDVTLPGEDQ